MTELADADRRQSERIADIPRMRQAMSEAIQQALLEHKWAGNPVAVWRNEQVVWIPPERIPEVLEDEPPEE
jgi:hypothetical protein